MRDGKHLILLVDDDPDVLESLRIVLEANNYEVATGQSAEEGLRVFKETHPDFILVDLMMEEIDAGTSFAKDLKANGNHAPVYMLSSEGDNLFYTIDAASIGLTGVFQKPINTDMLLSLLKVKLK